MQKKIVISIILSLTIIGGILYFMSDKPYSSEIADSQNVEIRNGIQYVTVVARGGYSPRTSLIQPELPTKLIVKTNNTYDCSAALVIPSHGFQKILEPTGEEIIDIGVIKKGGKIQGICSMGMYNFELKSR